MKKALLTAIALCFCPAAFAASVITTRLEDPKAIYLDAPATTADSSAALQAAIPRHAISDALPHDFLLDGDKTSEN